MRGYDGGVMKRWLILFLLIVMIGWIHGPDWWWATHVPAGRWFTGQASWVDQIDLSLYFRVIRYGMEQKSFLLPNMADSTNTATAVLYPVYTVIGMIAQPFSHDPVLVFHISGVVTGILLMMTAFWFVGLFIKNDIWRLIGWYWLFLTGGFGWLLYPGTVLPDIGVPIFNLWSALRSPHEAIMMISLMIFLGSSFRFFSQKKFQPGWLWGTGLSTGMIGVSHPQTLMPLGLIGGLFGLMMTKNLAKRRLWYWLGTIAVMTAVYFVTIGKTVSESPMTVGLRMQGTYVFPVWYWLAGWGVMGLLMVYGWKYYKKNVFIWLWLAIQLVLFYLPLVPYRGMMIRGTWIAVTLLGIQGAAKLAKKYVWKEWVVGLVVLVLSMGDMLFVFNKRMDIYHVGKTAFISQADGQMIRYLLQQGRIGEGVIGSYRMANIAMGQTRLIPYAGHYPLTPRFTFRYPEVIRFYQQRMGEAEAERWLKLGKISWIMMGIEEQQLANTSTLSYSFLKEVWTGQGVRVYRSSF
jgi:general stress protein CsbA